MFLFNINNNNKKIIIIKMSSDLKHVRCYYYYYYICQFLSDQRVFCLLLQHRGNLTHLKQNMLQWSSGNTIGLLTRRLRGQFSFGPSHLTSSKMLTYWVSTMRSATYTTANLQANSAYYTQWDGTMSSCLPGACPTAHRSTFLFSRPVSC